MTSSRREFLSWSAHGLGATAALMLLQQDGLLAEQAGVAGFPNFAPRAKRAVQINLVGGLSHLDSFDEKPELAKFHGKSLNTTEKPDIFFGQVGLLRQSDWEFKSRGQSGLRVSELFPHIAQRADDITVIKSMVADSANHTPALFQSNSGFQFNGFPSVGSWLSYGLGTETDALPAYVVLSDERGGPNGGSQNWTSGFLPAQHQGVELKSGPQPVRDLFPAKPINKEADQATRELLQALNQQQLERRGDDALLTARIRSYELAAKMQASIPEAADPVTEPEHIQQQYGIDQKQTSDMGRRCLLARRLLERGVRFVQLFSGGPIAGSPRASWDAHENVKDNHSLEAGRIDQPIAALLSDLKQRGLLSDTLVIFTTEFGRTPFAQSAATQVGPGRDHNRYGFSCWLAGAGLKPGISIGATDDIGWKAVERPVSWYDFHATVLHLFGINHERLTYYHNGIQRRLTSVHGDVLKEVLA